MNPYHLQVEDFALSEKGIHLLRNNFNFKTVGYNDVKSATVTKATEVRNAPIILCLGIAMLLFAFYQSRWVLYLFSDPSVHRIYIESIILPLIATSLGIYCVYSSLRKGPILKLEDEHTTHKLRLREIYKKKMVPEFEKFLRDQLGPRLLIDPSI